MSFNSKNIKNTVTYGSVIVSFLAIAVGVGFAIRSPLFLVQVVEVTDQPPALTSADKSAVDASVSENAPVDSQTIVHLAAVPVGKVNLFDLDLKAVERRILTHPWISQVNLQKKFPQTLSIQVVFREPVALIQDKKGGLAYVDRDGSIFGRVNVLARSNLPLLSGFERNDPGHIQEAIHFLALWEKASISHFSMLSTLSWEQERGYHAWLTYPIKSGLVRTSVDLGRTLDQVFFDIQKTRLESVLHYLSQNSVSAQQIWADSGKKIVVRTARGS